MDSDELMNDDTTLVDLIGDAGPAFTPDDAGAAAGELPPVDVDAALEGAGKWHETRVRSLLEAKGVLLHGTLAVAKGQSTEWLYTKADLDAIAAPLTRILNRYPATRIAAESGDEMALAMGFAGYGARTWSERRMALALRNAGVDFDGVPTAAAAPAPEPVDEMSHAAAAAGATTAADDPVEWPAPGEAPPIPPRSPR